MHHDPDARRLSSFLNVKDSDASEFERLQSAARSGARAVSDGPHRWMVYELPTSAFDRRASASLVFESMNVIRRVRDYPSNWRELTDEELLKVSEHI